MPANNNFGFEFLVSIDREMVRQQILDCTAGERCLEVLLSAIQEAEQSFECFQEKPCIDEGNWVLH